jgi:hypothetical protein
MAVEIPSSNVEAARQILRDINQSLAAGSDTNVATHQTKILLERLLAQHSDTLDLPPQQQSSQPNCAFLDTLCYDVRHMIYEQLLVANGPLKMWDRAPRPLSKHNMMWHARGGPPESMDRIGDWTTLSTDILRTCRQIYEEAMPVLYGKNNFALVHAPDALSWLERIGYRSIGQITSLVMYIRIHECGA